MSVSHPCDSHEHRRLLSDDASSHRIMKLLCHQFFRMTKVFATSSLPGSPVLTRAPDEPSSRIISSSVVCPNLSLLWSHLISDRDATSLLMLKTEARSNCQSLIGLKARSRTPVPGAKSVKSVRSVRAAGDGCDVRLHFGRWTVQ